MSILQILMFIITLIVGGAKFDGESSRNVLELAPPHLLLLRCALQAPSSRYGFVTRGTLLADPSHSPTTRESAPALLLIAFGLVRTEQQDGRAVGDHSALHGRQGYLPDPQQRRSVAVRMRVEPCVALRIDQLCIAVRRLVTPILLHAGILHLLGNMFFQLRFGFVMELRWGIARFAGLYFLTGQFRLSQSARFGACPRLGWALLLSVRCSVGDDRPCSLRLTGPISCGPLVACAGVGASFWSAVLSPNAVSVGASGALFGTTSACSRWKWSPHHFILAEPCSSWSCTRCRRAGLQHRVPVVQLGGDSAARRRSHHDGLRHSLQLPVRCVLLIVLAWTGCPASLCCAPCSPFLSSLRSEQRGGQLRASWWPRHGPVRRTGFHSGRSRVRSFGVCLFSLCRLHSINPSLLVRSRW